MDRRSYTTALAKGQGMIPETLAMLNIWQPGMTTSELAKAVLESGILSRATALRSKDLVNRVFARRYLVMDGLPAAHLKRLAAARVPLSQLSQLLLIHTARANLILHDFIRKLYWGRYAAAATHLNREDALGFIEFAIDDGFISPPWSPSMKVKVGRYLLNALEKFGLLGPLHHDRREMLPFAIAPADHPVSKCPTRSSLTF